ncbi:MAG: aromatic ring-hydroxylating dioxygenase subunit alpha [Rhizobacter sp.]|nr:aromatic ring-hydroxylating dioxygenase subunit alpha [Rhizobacter sp.]
MTFPFTIGPDVAEARTLPSAFYLDTAVHALTRERVFARTWQWLGELDDVAAPGSLSPRELLPGHLAEPLLLVRNAAGELGCLSNVCTHRGNVLVHAPCRAEQIRCGYHSRRFDLAGRMTFMPGFEGARGFPGASDDLPRVAVGEFGGEAFASLAPAAPFEAFFAPIRERLAWLPLAAMRHDPSRDRSFEIAAHWAIYVENYLEGLHIPFLHPALQQVLDMQHYRYELGRYGNLQLALASGEDAATFAPPPSSRDHGRRVAAYYWWVFPNVMLNFYPWGLSLNVVEPLAPDRTRVVFRAYVLDAGRLGSGAGAQLDQVELEDEAAVESVQRGLRSRLYDRGRYSPAHERGVHQFHRLLCEFLADAA